MTDRYQLLDDKELEDVTGGIGQDSCFVYTIRKGDCLSVIAQRYGTTVKVLCEINNIKNPDILSGYTTILVPYNIQAN